MDPDQRPDPTPSEGPDPYGNPDPAPAWRQIDWRARMRWLELGGSAVNIVDTGGGDELPCLLVHGLAGSWQDWLETIPAISESRRVIALDLPGFGHSPTPPWALTIEGYGRFLGELLDELGVERCALVGHSMGGLISAEAAVAQPGRFPRLALFAAAGISSTSRSQRATGALARVVNATLPVIAEIGPRALTRPRMRRTLFAASIHDASAISPELLLERLEGSASPPGLVAAVAGIVGYDIRDALPTLPMPTLIAWGRDDNVVPVADALEFGRLIEHSQTVILDRTGHMLQIERPVRVNRLLERFLRQ